MRSARMLRSVGKYNTDCPSYSLMESLYKGSDYTPPLSNSQNYALIVYLSNLMPRPVPKCSSQTHGCGWGSVATCWWSTKSPCSPASCWTKLRSSAAASAPASEAAAQPLGTAAAAQQPFWGIQLVLVGELYKLPPIASAASSRHHCSGSGSSGDGCCPHLFLNRGWCFRAQRG